MSVISLLGLLSPLGGLVILMLVHDKPRPVYWGTLAALVAAAVAINTPWQPGAVGVDTPLMGTAFYFAVPMVICFLVYRLPAFRNRRKLVVLSAPVLLLGVVLASLLFAYAMAFIQE